MTYPRPGKNRQSKRSVVLQSIGHVVDVRQQLCNKRLVVHQLWPRAHVAQLSVPLSQQSHYLPAVFELPQPLYSGIRAQRGPGCVLNSVEGHGMLGVFRNN